MKIKTTFLSFRTTTPVILAWFIMAMIFILPVISSAQQTNSEDHELREIQNITAPVKVDGTVLFYVRGITSFPAEKRAETISLRIIKAAKDHAISADSGKIIPGDDMLMIYIGDAFIMNVYESDAKIESVSQSTVAQVNLAKTQQAIKSYRNERSSPVMVQKVLYAAGAAVILTVTLLLLFWILKRLNIGLRNRIRSRIESMEDKSFRLIRSVHLWRAIRVVFRLFKIALILVIVAVFLQYILGLFPHTRSIAAYSLELILSPIISLGNAFINFLPSLAFLILIYLVTRYLLRLMKLFFTGIHEGAMKLQNFDAEWAMPTYKITRLIVIIFALVIAYPYIPGSETSAFKGISVFLGVLLSLGSSSFISNLIAGYSMTYRAAFKKGDLIQVGDQLGFVEEQKILVTRLRSVKNEEISIPNSLLLNSNIMNYSTRAKDLGLILHTSVGIGYETPWRQVDAMLKLAADRTEGLLKEPPPFVLKKSLGDFAVDYEINAYCNDASKMRHYYNLLHQNILDIFNENDVQIMTPAYEGDPETPKVVPKDQWFKPLSTEG